MMTCKTELEVAISCTQMPGEDEEECILEKPVLWVIHRHTQCSLQGHS